MLQQPSYPCHSATTNSSEAVDRILRNPSCTLPIAPACVDLDLRSGQPKLLVVKLQFRQTAAASAAFE
jgi:hypothetical protein